MSFLEIVAVLHKSLQAGPSTITAT